MAWWSARFVLATIPIAAVLAADVPDPSTDPTAVAPDDYRILLDNEHVRVLDHRLPAKGREARHFHPPRLTVNLADQLSRVTLDGGASVEREYKAGQAIWREAEYHEVQSLSDKPGREIIVELKRADGDMSTSAAWTRVAGPRAVDARDARVSRVALLGSRALRGPFAERVRLSDGYAGGARRQSSEQHVLVLAGRYCLGYGERMERASAQCHGPGAFIAIQAAVPHYEWVEGDTVLHVEGTGPAEIVHNDAAAGAPVSAPQPAATAPATPVVVVTPVPAAPAPQPPPPPQPERAPVAVTPIPEPAPLVESLIPSGGTVLRPSGVPDPKPATPPFPAAAPATAAPVAAAVATPAPAPVATRPGPATTLPKIRARDYDFHYDERGKGALVLAVHGALGDHRQFEPLMNPLSRSRRVIAYSRRYHYPNAGPGPVEAYAPGEQANDLLAIVAALGNERAVVLAQGDGAAIALLAAMRQTTRIGHLILIEPSVPELLGDAKIAEALAARRRLMHEEARKLYKPDAPGGALRVLVDDLMGNGGFDGARSEDLKVWQDNAVLVTLGAPAPTGIDCAALKRLATPVLVLRGGNSSDARRAEARALERCLGHGEGMEISEAGYAIQRDQPGTLMAAIDLFLQANK